MLCHMCLSLSRVSVCFLFIFNVIMLPITEREQWRIEDGSFFKKEWKVRIKRQKQLSEKRHANPAGDL